MSAPDTSADVPVPTISDGVPSSCLVCTVRGDWGHFRRVDRTVTKQTYRIMPRTTAAGLLAAIVGVGRDGYYNTFGPDVSAVGIEVLPETDLRTMTNPSLGLGTNPGESFDSAGGTGRKSVKVTYPDSTDNRQIHSYEYLVNPAYRLYIGLEDASFYEQLAARLNSGTAHYTPSLGLSELLASVETHRSSGGHVSIDVESVEVDDTVTVDSAIPGAVSSIVPDPGQSHYVERVPGFMSTDDGGRKTTGFVDYAFSPAALTTRADDLALGRVTIEGTDRTIAFV